MYSGVVDSRRRHRSQERRTVLCEKEGLSTHYIYIYTPAWKKDKEKTESRSPCISPGLENNNKPVVRARQKPNRPRATLGYILRGRSRSLAAECEMHSTEEKNTPTSTIRVRHLFPRLKTASQINRPSILRCHRCCYCFSSNWWFVSPLFSPKYPAEESHFNGLRVCFCCWRSGSCMRFNACSIMQPGFFEMRRRRVVGGLLRKCDAEKMLGPTS